MMRRKIENWAGLLLLSWIVFCFGTIASAQGFGLLGSVSGGSETSDIAEVISQAADAGVGVIVIDPQGNILSPLPHAGAVDHSAPEAGASLMKAQENANAFRNALFLQLSQLPTAVTDVLRVLRDSSPDGTLMAYIKVLVLSLGLFAIGMVFERYVYGRRIAAQFVIPLIKDDPKGYIEKMPFLTIRFLAGVIGIVVSMVVAYVLGFVIFGPLTSSSIQYTATLVNIGYFSARAIAGVWRMILSPYLEQYRIPRMTNHDARRLHLWLTAVVIVGFFVMLFGAWIRELGVTNELNVFITLFLGFGVMLLNILLVIVNRGAITKALLNGVEERAATWPVRFLARLWMPAVLVYLMFAWGELAYDMVLGFNPGVPLIAGAYAILTVVLVVYGVINYLIERGFARARAMRMINAQGGDAGEDMSQDVPDIVLASRNKITSFEGLARRIAGILAFVAGFYAFLSFWAPENNLMEGSVPDRTLDIIVIVFLGYIVFHVFRIWIDNKIREEQGDDVPAELGDEGGGSSASRLATLLPLFKNFVLIVIVVTVGLIVLMEMGVNVGPLFAGAGIVGVAVGFGSQSLVRDIFSGAFFLFDDAFRKGEYIEIGDVKGTVENISVRSFQLRHHLGKLHTIPFGEIQVLSNYSRDWVMMKLPLRVTYDTDVDKVRKLVKKLGQELLNDPVIGDDFIQPLKSQGVIEMQDSAMIIRVKFMTKPGDQWVARKRVYEEIRAMFEREGIKFAHREVTVRLAEGPSADQLNPKQKDAVLAAAEAALEEEDIADAMDGDER